MEPNQNLLNSDMYMDTGIQNHLKEASMWAKIIGIVGFIVSGIIAVLSPFIPQILETNPAYSASPDIQLAGMTFTILYLIMAAFGFMVSLFIFRFAIMTRRAIANSDQIALDKGMQNLKFLFRTWGVITVIYLGFIALATLIGLASIAFA